jgi:hypothetical protein
VSGKIARGTTAMAEIAPARTDARTDATHALARVRACVMLERLFLLRLRAHAMYSHALVYVCPFARCQNDTIVWMWTGPAPENVAAFFKAVHNVLAHSSAVHDDMVAKGRSARVRPPVAVAGWHCRTTQTSYLSHVFDCFVCLSCVFPSALRANHSFFVSFVVRVWLGGEAGRDGGGEGGRVGGRAGTMHNRRAGWLVIAVVGPVTWTPSESHCQEAKAK